MSKDIGRVFRYIKIYGVLRTLTKVIGRLRPKFKFWLILKFPFYSRKGKKIGIVGCGHHAFSSIAYYLTLFTNSKILFTLDVDARASSSLAYAYNAVDLGAEYKQQTDMPDVVYIASNHATHTEYAINFLKLGCDVFIEKPISISFEQLNNLSDVVNKSGKQVYVGYNRPHSPAVSIIKRNFTYDETPFTLSCFISGHFIPEDHWYRDPSEGTRIVANLGHWLDLATHIFFWSRKRPSFLDITISYSDTSTPSDNIAVSIVSPNHDLVNLTFTSRSEPYEGVNETINFQQGDLIAKVDDFRSTQIWKGSMYKKYIHWPKNNGHKSTVLQPFESSTGREWGEIEYSTRLMLYIEEMVTTKETYKRIKF